MGRKGRANYSKLGPDGVVPVGTEVMEGDVLISKVARLTDHFGEHGVPGGVLPRSKCRFEKKYPRASCTLSRTQHAGTGLKIVWVKVRCVRRPEVGDKFASFAAQKGTIGLVIRDEDVPQSLVSGIIPAS